MLSRLKPIFHRPMVQVTDGLDDGKPQSVALLPHITGAETTEERFPVKRFAVRRHIANRKAFVFYDNPYLAAGCRMTDGIDDKVFQQAFQKDGIGANCRVAVRTSVVHAQGCLVLQRIIKWL